MDLPKVISREASVSSSQLPRTVDSVRALPDGDSVAGLSLFDGQFGFENYAIKLTVSGRERVFARFQVVEEAGAWRLEAGDGEVSVTILLAALGRPHQYGARVWVCNEGGADAVLEAAAFGQFGESARFMPGMSHVLGWGLRYAHTGNLRTELYPLCAADYPYVRQLPMDRRILGNTEDQPFPALFIYNDNTRAGIVLGMASQRAAIPVFAMRRKPLFMPDVFEEFAMQWDFPQSAGPRIAAGATLELETIYLQFTQGKLADFAFEDYLDYLERENGFRGKRSPMNEEAIHCTWNYGVYNDQREEPLLKTARFIASEMPLIKWFLMDDGYLGGTVKRRSFLNCFYPDPERFLQAEDWPRGIRAFTAELRSLGLRPGIWWTPTVHLPCELYDDHPDWFLREKDGNLQLIGKDLAYLDFSHPEALAFLDRTLAVILKGWGFEACKIDFWSQNFESPRARLHDPHASGVEIRRKFFETVRRYLPADGVIMSCIAMGMGDPFMGEFVDTYRCSMDISGGEWHDQINSCHWSLPMLGFGGRRSALLNTDSAGINLDLPDNENLFRLTWCHVTMGIIETGGRLETLPPKYLGWMQKLTERIDRGYPCRCPEYGPYTGFPLPETLYVDFPPESLTAKRGVRQTVAFFNWTDEPRAVSLDRTRIGQPASVEVEDFWTGERENWGSRFVTLTVEPRSARLFEVRY